MDREGKVSSGDGRSRSGRKGKGEGRAKEATGRTDFGRREGAGEAVKPLELLDGSEH